LQALASEGAILLRNPASRFAFLLQEEGLLLFADGATFPCSGDAAALAQRICAQDHVVLDPSLADAMELLAALVNQGSLMVDDDEEED
jgi:50S ribosomal protein L16 3-hydroxylase